MGVKSWTILSSAKIKSRVLPFVTENCWITIVLSAVKSFAVPSVVEPLKNLPRYQYSFFASSKVTIFNVELSIPSIISSSVILQSE